METENKFAIIDCNNFFVSCERIFQPTLNNVPVIVLSNNDGCAIARSNEAKRIGIQMGEPYFKIQSLIRKYNIKVFSSNFSLYNDISNRIMNILFCWSKKDRKNLSGKLWIGFALIGGIILMM